MMRRLSRLRFLFGRWRRSSSHERALDAEVQAYLDADIDARVRAGESVVDARRQALMDLGGIEQVKEVVRDRRAGAWVDGVVQDLRYALRTLGKSPSFTGSVVGSVSIGMAAMIAGYAFANAMLFLETPGVRDPKRLVEINVEFLESRFGWHPGHLYPSDYRVLADRLRDVAPIAASVSADVSVTLPAARSLHAAVVTDNYFEVLDARFVTGGPIRPGPDGGEAPDTVVLAHHLWKREFGGDAAVVGRVIYVGDFPSQISGVAAPEFRGPWTGPEMQRPDLWIPMRLADRIAATASAWTVAAPSPPRERQMELVVGRLRPGAEISQAEALAAPVVGQLTDARPGTLERRVTVAHLGDQVRRWWGPLVMIVLPVPILVLAIACVNAANLLLARVTVREREIAVRLAIGAGRGRIVRQLLLESLVLASASTVLAVPLTIAGLRLAEEALSMSMPLDSVVISVTVATVVMCAIAFGLAPALRATSRSPARGLSHSHAGDATPQKSRVRRTLVVVQVAVSLALLALGSQLIASIRSTEPAAGTPSGQLLVASFDVRQLKMSPDQAQRFYATLLARVSARPEVAAAGLAPARGASSHGLPFSFSGGRDGGIFVRYQPYGLRDGFACSGGYAAGDLFGAIGLRVLAGRAFTADDQQGARPRVAVVNQTFADRILKGRALGQILEVTRDGTGAPVPVEVVGVIEPTYEPSGGHGSTSRPSVYIPVALAPIPGLTLFASSRTSAGALMPIVREIVHDIDARVAFLQFGSLDDVMRSGDRKLAFVMALFWLAAILGVMAMALAGWGLYAVMSHIVAMRSREFAIRIALGAETRAILGMVGWQAGLLALVGGAIGTFAGVLLGVSIRANWSGTVAAGAGALLLSASVLAAVMFVASFVPAARAARVSPIELLKES